MVHRMDTEIGRVMEQLKKMGVFDNTVVFFLSDNGASAEQIIRGDGHDRGLPPGAAGPFFRLGPAGRARPTRPFACTNHGCMKAASAHR